MIDTPCITVTITGLDGRGAPCSAVAALMAAMDSLGQELGEDHVPPLKPVLLSSTGDGRTLTLVMECW